MTTGASIDCPKSENNFFNQTTSHATIATPLYFASVLNSATISYFLLLQLTSPFLKENMKPLVDLLSETLPAQSASVYACTCNWLLASQKISHYKVCFMYLSTRLTASKCGFRGVCMN
jgi:hypothetical protein